MSEETSPANAVRRYLLWLEDPSSLIDGAAVARAEALVRDATDPLDRLHALAALERARHADADGVIADFVAHAHAYAEAESIPVSAFQAAGVGTDVLARAGFDVGARPRGRGRSSGGGGEGAAARSPKVSIDELKAATLRLPKQFTLAQVAEAAGGGSPQTVRKAVDELIAEGRARSLGPKTDHHGRGRAPTLYELI